VVLTVSAAEAILMIYGILVFVHIVICLFLMIVVLLQSGKAADLAGAFGGMGSQTAFGPRGSATMLSNATAIAAGLFMVTSLSLAIMASGGAAGVGSTVLDSTPVRKSAPAASRPLPVAPKPSVGGGTTSVPAGQPISIPMPPAQQQPAPAKK
jgi:preprotein translocase subunit SecG